MSQDIQHNGVEELEHIIDRTMKSTEFELHNLSNKQLRKLHKFYHLKNRGFSKYAIIKQLTPIKKRLIRIKILEDSDYEEDCPVCFMRLKSNTFTITDCAHIFCQECMIRHVIVGKNEFCPLCREPVYAEDIAVLPISDEILESMGVLRINQPILDTGLILLEHMRFQQYITDPEMIRFIRRTQERQNSHTKIGLFIKLVLVIFGIYLLVKV
jgi:hypothetical protein